MGRATRGGGRAAERARASRVRRAPATAEGRGWRIDRPRALSDSRPGGPRRRRSGPRHRAEVDEVGAPGGAQPGAVPLSVETDANRNRTRRFAQVDGVAVEDDLAAGPLARRAHPGLRRAV